MDLSWIESVGVGSWIFLILFTLLTVYYYYLTYHFGYLEKQGVPVQKPWPLLGTMKMNVHMKDMENDYYKRFGRFYGTYEGRMPGIVVAEPNLIRQVTIKDFSVFPYGRDLPVRKNDKVSENMLMFLRGEQWKGVRSIMTPAFTTGKLKQMTHLIEECCNELNEYLEKFAETGEPFEARNTVSCLTMDVIASCAFGFKIDSLSNPNNTFLQKAKQIFRPPMWLLVLLLFFPKLFHLIPSKLLKKATGDPVSYFTDLIGSIIALKKTEQRPRQDFLELLLEAEIDTNEESGKEPSNREHSKKILNEDLIKSQCILFLLAGHETSATALSLALYCLALNPEVQDNLAAEVDRVLDEHKDKISYECISEMHYLEMVVSETLRIFPPGVRIERTCVEDGYELNGVKLMKGMLVGIPVYSIHHDPEFYPEPEKFDPERFNAENKAARDPVLYLPFGSGPRNCIGMRFALIEVKMALASIIRKFRVKRCSQTESSLKFAKTSGILQPESVTLSIEKRK